MLITISGEQTKTLINDFETMPNVTDFPLSKANKRSPEKYLVKFVKFGLDELNI